MIADVVPGGATHGRPMLPGPLVGSTHQPAWHVSPGAQLPGSPGRAPDVHLGPPGFSSDAIISAQAFVCR